MHKATPHLRRTALATTLAMVCAVGCTTPRFDAPEELWARSVHAAEQGTDRIARGRARIEEGRLEIRDGERLVAEGRAAVESARLEYVKDAPPVGSPRRSSAARAALRRTEAQWDAAMLTIRRGNTLVDAGRAMVERGHDDVREGRAMVEGAHEMMRAARAQLPEPGAIADIEPTDE